MRGVPDISDVLATEEHLRSRTQVQAFCHSGIALKYADVVTTFSPLHDYPHSIHPSIRDAPSFARLDVEQQLGGVAGLQVLSLCPVRYGERLWMFFMPDLC